MEKTKRLWRIEGFTDLWADACLRSDDGLLLFLSFYGRDTAMMQFISAIELGNKAEGVQRFNLVDSTGGRHLVEVGIVDRLEKHTVRLPRQNLFGPLSQMWIYDRNLQEIDKPNRIGWIVEHGGDSQALRAKAWQLVKTLAPIALLDHWQEPLLQWCLERRAISQAGQDRYPVLGDIQAVRVSVSDHFVRHVSQSVRDGLLRLE